MNCLTILLILSESSLSVHFHSIANFLITAKEFLKVLINIVIVIKLVIVIITIIIKFIKKFLMSLDVAYFVEWVWQKVSLLSF